MPIVKRGHNLSSLICARICQNRMGLEDGDIVVLAQKIVSKAEGRQVPLDSVKPSRKAIELAAEVEKDPRLVELIIRESTEIMRKKTNVLIVRHKLGHVGAHAGIDQSNIDHEHGPQALLLPKDPDKSAERIRKGIEHISNTRVGVIVSDSANRPWRLGTVGIAIGSSNLTVLDDRRGEEDLFDRELKVTLINRADCIASAASLVMGESTERTPVVVVRGFQPETSDQTASQINRPLDEDLFR